MNKRINNIRMEEVSALDATYLEGLEKLGMYVVYFPSGGICKQRLDTGRFGIFLKKKTVIPLVRFLVNDTRINPSSGFSVVTF